MSQHALHGSQPSHGVVEASLFLLQYEFLNEVSPTYLPSDA